MAASSGDPGGSRKRWPALGQLQNDFGELTYLQLRSKDERKPLSSDPFIVGLSVEAAAGGPIEDAATEAQGTRWTLKVRNQAQVTKLLKLTTLSDGADVIVEPHPNLNVSRCVISCYEIVRMSEQDILHGLTSQGVMRVQRITRKEQGNPVNTPALILTFSRCNYPSHVKIGLLRVATRPYYPNPLLCYGCVRFGHPRARCPGPKRCLNCSAEHELAEGETCPAAAHCINCNGQHRPNNRQCPVYKKEVEVIRLKVDHNLTFPEARKRVEQGLGSYAAAAAQQTATQRRLEELEKKMEAKDVLISQLMAAMKEKDDKIEELMSQTRHVQIPAPENQESQSTYPKPTQVNQHISPIESTHHNHVVRKAIEPQTKMQLRNRSPAILPPKVIEQGAKKKKKRQNRSNNSSPGRQSPPPKKIPAEQPPSSDQETFSVDEEIEETPRSQHVR